MTIDRSQWISRAIPMEKRIAYNMAEFDALKKEVAALVAQTTADLRYAILLSGAVIAWIMTKVEANAVFDHGKYIPLISSLLFGGHSLICYLRIGEKREYLLKLERKLTLPGLGWEEHFEQCPSRLGYIAIAIWVALIMGNIVVAWTLHMPDHPPSALAGL